MAEYLSGLLFPLRSDSAGILLPPEVNLFQCCKSVTVRTNLDKKLAISGIVRFDRSLRSNAPELCGRIHLFFISATVFMSLRLGNDASTFLLHERAVFDFLKQKRLVSEMLQSSTGRLNDNLYANIGDNDSQVEFLIPQII